MESGTPTLSVVYSATALKELDRIWAYNAEFYQSADHADEYVDFLKSEIKNLSRNYSLGKFVATNVRFKYVVMGRKTRGHAHIAVYRVT